MTSAPPPGPAQQWTLWTQFWDLLHRMAATHGYAGIREFRMSGPTQGELLITYHYKSEATGGEFGTLSEAVALAERAYTQVFGETPICTPRAFQVTDHDDGSRRTVHVRGPQELAHLISCDQDVARVAWHNGRADSRTETVLALPGPSLP